VGVAIGAALVASLPDIDVVGEASNGGGVRRETLLDRPEVVVVDLHMPGTNGVDATRAILARRPAPAYSY
jgi:DNA-binding NarL/FixJ family response regulator